MGKVGNGRVITAPMILRRIGLDLIRMRCMEIFGLGIEHIAEFAVFAHLLPCLDKGPVEAVFTRHIFQLGVCFYGIAQQLGFFQSFDGGYLADDMLSGFQRHNGMLGMQRFIRSDQNSVNVALQKLFDAVKDQKIFYAVADIILFTLAQSLRVAVCNGTYNNIAVSNDRPRHIGTSLKAYNAKLYNFLLHDQHPFGNAVFSCRFKSCCFVISGTPPQHVLQAGQPYI